MIAPSTSLLPRVVDPHNTNPLRIRAIRHALIEEKMRLRACAEQETQRMPAITVKIPRVPVTRPLLPLDNQARPYYVIARDWRSTLELIKAAIEEYSNYQHAYPSTILLSPIRFLALPKGITHYHVGRTTIPLSFEGTTFLRMHQNFEVLVRGEHE